MAYITDSRGRFVRSKITGNLIPDMSCRCSECRMMARAEATTDENLGDQAEVDSNSRDTENAS